MTTKARAALASLGTRPLHSEVMSLARDLHSFTSGALGELCNFPNYVPPDERPWLREWTGAVVTELARDSALLERRLLALADALAPPAIEADAA